MSVRNLESLFQPASVAVVGISPRPGNIGRIVYDNLKGGQFAGPMWLVDSQVREVDGERCFDSIDALPSAPELAVICTPAQAVPGIVDALGRKGTRAAIVISAGMRQVTMADGRNAEQAMLDAARPHLLRILGPNCLGLISPAAHLNASFAPGQALPGKLAFVTQSGALATAMLDWANAQGVGFSNYVSLGDSADADFGDMLDYLGSDARTRAILMYMESVKDARKFMSAARAAARNKPVIVVKAGRAPAGAKAAASHTGALAGSDAVFDAAVRRAGMLRVASLEALFDAAETLGRVGSWRGERLALLTNGGGAGVLAADALALGGGKLAELSPQTIERLDACLPGTWPRGNPVDIIGDAPAQRYVDALRILLDAREVDGVLFMHAPTAVVPADEIAAACIPIMKAAGKPVLSCWLGGAVVAQSRRACSEAGLAGYATPERAVAAWLQRVDYARNQEALLQLPSAELDDFTPDITGAKALIAEALDAGHEWLDEEQSKQLLRAYGIPVVDTRRAANVEEAVDLASRIGYPVAVKVVSPQVLHKSDVGGVALNLASADEVRTAIVRMRQRIARLKPNAQIRGFTVQAMVHRPHAHELIVGIASDPVFGPVIMFGEGGTAVELRKDSAVGLPPLNDQLARDLIAQTQVAPLLAGYRGRPGVDQSALVGALLRVSLMACELASLVELDINPLLADEEGVVALDARVRVRAAKPGEATRLALPPYPKELEETVQANGSELFVRPIRPEDGARLQAFYEQASPNDMRLRFFMARRDVPHSELARYCQIDYTREMTFIALAPPDEQGARAMAGEARAVSDPDNRVAEFAVQVTGDWQNKGLGRVLMKKVMDYLRARGLERVVGHCLTDNSGMMALARELGFTVTRGDGGDTMLMEMQLR